MNVIEYTRNALLRFPKIAQICNSIHIDFTEAVADNYGLSPTGDTLLGVDVIGNERRQHSFIFYAVYDASTDYDRINNSGVILELQQYLEAKGSKLDRITATDGEKTWNASVTRIEVSNGMLFAVPSDNYLDAVRYQLQLNVEYKIYKN